MKRVGYYLSSTAFGGTEHYLLTLLRHVDRSRFSPVVYFRCLKPDDALAIRAQLRRLDVPIRELDEDGLPGSRSNGASTQDLLFVTRHDDTVAPHRVPRWPLGLKASALRLAPASLKLSWFYWRRVSAAARALRDDKLQIMHFLHPGYPSLAMPVLASDLAGIPIRISDIQQEPSFCPSAPAVKQYLLGLSSRRVTHVRTMTQQMRARLQQRCRIPEDKMRVIYSGVDIPAPSQPHDRARLRAALGLPTQHRLIITVGRLSAEKGHRFLIRAIALLRDTAQDVRWLLVGDGPLRGALEADVAEQRLGDAVRFLGFRDDVQDLLAASDIVVLPSLIEGVPWVLLEAMAAGKPIVATDVGGIGEILDHQPFGRVVPAEDASALARALGELLRLDDATLMMLGQAARGEVRSKYSEAAMLKQVFALYDTADGAPHGPAGR